MGHFIEKLLHHEQQRQLWRCPKIVIFNVYIYTIFSAILLVYKYCFHLINLLLKVPTTYDIKLHKKKGCFLV